MESSQSQIFFLRTFAELGQRQLDPAYSLLIYDRKLDKVSSKFRSWRKKFAHQYAVNAGESLKDIAKFSGHVAKIAKVSDGIPARKLTIIAVGGGSIGDFAGFLASVYKRGVDLVHVPSTWLAAIDSSHGGKTALNVGGAKNQIGTFYPASKVILVRELLFAQDDRRSFDALGELAKIALLSGGSLVRRLEKSHKHGNELLWDFLKDAIAAKMSVVRKDPREKTGIRQILNLGHTLGHAFEAKYGWPHGFSISQGLFFTIELSEGFGLLKSNEADRAMSLLSHLGLTPVRPQKKFSASELTTLLSKDKKSDRAASVTFIALSKIGKPQRVEMPIRDLVSEARRQGWVR
ncbi:MAG TPA: 3-dehydroquinate synthase family protein [Bdellovibrionales bacterium]|nr:3-dehydroquinate synthase family protein [Bdellovibrionales bacterium]